MDTIKEIRNKDTNELVNLSSCSIQKIAVKYSNTKDPIVKMVISNKAISRNNKFLVTFKCPTCNTCREITLNLFMRRVSKNTSTCYCCMNRTPEKCEKQSVFMKEHMTSILTGEYTKVKEKVSEKTLEDYLSYSRESWEKEDIEIINHYNLTHLSSSEFDSIKSKIRGIGNEKLISLDGWSYFPNYRIFNQTRYTPMLINTALQKVEKPQYITFCCENCGRDFKHRDLEIVKNKIKIYCQECSLTNRTFRLRPYILKNNTQILWQSIPEKRFIEWCEEHFFEIKNGPSISYSFQENMHKYRVDFELPSHKILVEIKDNHCWHKQQVSSGKFGAKEKAAQKWSQENGYTFYVVFPKTLQMFKDSILRLAGLLPPDKDKLCKI